MKIYFCKICNIKISRYSAKYGKSLCHSCATRKAFAEGRLNNRGINSGMYGKKLSKLRKKQLREQMTGNKNHRYIDGRTNKKYFCEDCGVQISNIYAKKCRKCYGEWVSKNIRGIKHHNYKDGMGRFPYPSDFSVYLKKQIRKRDNYECQLCGMTEEEHLIVRERVLEVHHIDRNKTNNNMTNLIALCYNCHNKVTFKK